VGCREDLGAISRKISARYTMAERNQMGREWLERLVEQKKMKWGGEDFLY
jgi:hypothetical protein